MRVVITTKPENGQISSTKMTTTEALTIVEGRKQKKRFTITLTMILMLSNNDVIASITHEEL